MTTKHPFHELLQKTDQTDMEKVALYGVMRTSAAPDFAHLTPEETWDRMIQEYNNLKMIAHFEGVPQDLPQIEGITKGFSFGEPAQNRGQSGIKAVDLDSIPISSKLKN
jgi:hypothetical protein